MKKCKTLLVTLIALLMVFAVVACGGGGAGSPAVVYETNGGEAIAKVDLEKGEKHVLPTPVREGYEFEGWYTKKDFSGEKVTTIIAEKKVTVYAKWAKLYALTLNLNGGTLATTTINLKAGENVATALEEYVPTKTDHQFGQWLLANAPLSASYVMPEEDITLTAQYKVKYVIEYYYRDIDADTYSKSDNTFVAYAYEGETIAPQNVALTGFERVNHNDTVASITVGNNVEQNVLRFYYDRKDYVVTYKIIYPDGKTEDDIVVEAKYGEMLVDPYYYNYEGYYLAGWSYFEDAMVVDFPSNYINDKLGRAEQGTVKVESTLTLYSVWEKAYADMHGTRDRIYVNENDGEAYLCRQNVYFTGEYDVTNDMFVIYDKNGDVLVSGKILEDNKFIYKNSEREGTSFYLYEPGTGLVQDRIFFDAYNGITYAKAKADGTTTESKGTYIIDEEGYYLATFTSGELKGKTLHFTVGTVHSSTMGDLPAFLSYSPEEKALGNGDRGGLVLMMIYQGQLVWYQIAYEITLDGLYLATYVNGQYETEQYEYSYDEETQILTFYDPEEGGIYKQFKVITEVYDEGTLDEFRISGYMEYHKELDGTFETVDGSYLTLDGIREATFSDGVTSFVGSFSMGKSLLTGNRLITLTNTIGEQKVFELVKDGDNYEINVKPTGYAEFAFMDEDGNFPRREGEYYSEMLLVLNDTAVGNASVYTTVKRSEDNDYKVEYELAASGTYENLGGGKYRFISTSDSVINPPYAEFNPSQMESFDFGINDTMFVMPAFFCYSTLDKTGYERNYDVKTYQGEDEEGNKYVLTLIVGMALLDDGEAQAYFQYYDYEKEEGFSILYDPMTGMAIYVSVEEGEGIFHILTTPPTKYYRYVDIVNIDDSVYLYVDGKGGAIYREIELDEDGKEVILKEVVGNITDIEDTNEKTILGDGLALFEAEDGSMSFYFLYLSNDNGTYFSMKGDVYGEFTNEEDGSKVIFDGFGYRAQVITGEETIEGFYHVLENGTYVIKTDNYTYLVDLVEDNFTYRGNEYGAFLLIDNNKIDGTIIEFDGYGHAKVFTEKVLEDGEIEKIYIDEAATYVETEKGLELTFVNKDKTITIHGTVGIYGDYNVFIVFHDEFSGTYQNKADNTIVTFDDIGNAIRYDKTGKEDYGYFEIISEEMLFFRRIQLQGDENDAVLYKYDRTDMTIEKIALTSAMYYSEDFRSIKFYTGGQVQFGEVVYYYNFDENDNVIIYRPAEEGETANAYGFYEDKSFGARDDEKLVDGIKYYLHDGYSVTFERKAGTEAEFAYEENGKWVRFGTLSFAPTGNGEFTAAGVIKIKTGSKEETYDAEITREVDDEGKVKMYVKAGSLVIHIDAKYTPTTTCEYVVTKLEIIRTYLDVNYYEDAQNEMMMMFNVIPENKYGYFEIYQELDKDGNIIKDVVNTYFGELSSAKNEIGEVFNYTESSYTIINGAIVELEDLYTTPWGYKYKMRMAVRNSDNYLGVGYDIYLTRVQTFEYENYTLELEKLVAKPASYDAKYYSFVLKEDGVEVPQDGILGYTEFDVTYINRQKDNNGKVLAAIYYEITMTINSYIPSTGELLYNGFSVKKITDIQIVYAEDGFSFAEIDTENNTVKHVRVNGLDVGVLAGSCTYDEATGVYTIKQGGRTITVKVVEKDGTKYAEISAKKD